MSDWTVTVEAKPLGYAPGSEWAYVVRDGAGNEVAYFDDTNRLAAESMASAKSYRWPGANYVTYDRDGHYAVRNGHVCKL